MATRTIQQRLANAIRTRRKELDLTQEAAAANSGVSVRFWRDLEAAKPATVGLDVVEGLIAGLNWSWAEVIAVISPKEASETPASVQRLLDEAWRRATVRERDIVTAGLRVLAGERRTKS
jgi:transcriptional regulator with XRE-family HTH domain